MFHRVFGGFFNFKLLTLISSIFILIISGSSVFARDFTLAWDPNSEPDLSHYVIYWGTSAGDYTDNSGNVGQMTEHEVTIPDDGQIYYFAVTAVNSAGLESDFSNEVNTSELRINAAPVADAGSDQSVEAGVQVMLDGSNSVDPDGSIATYRWAQTGGISVVLDNPGAAQPAFEAPAVDSDGVTLIFELSVTDSEGLQSTDTCLVNVVYVADPANDPPADNTDPVPGEYPSVPDGSGTVALTRNFTLTWDPNSEPDLSHYIVYWGTSSGKYTEDSGNIGPVTEYSIELPNDGVTYYFATTAVNSMGQESSFSNEVNTSGLTINTPPIANAGSDQNVEEGVQVLLNGSNSVNQAGSTVSYEWTQIKGTPVVLDDPASMQPTFESPFVSPEGETLIFQLSVTNSEGLQSTDTCLVNVIWVNDPPIASAGADQNVEEGLQVVLDGSNSVDPDGSILSYLWTQTGGTPVALDDPSAMQPTFESPFVAPEGETFMFQLSVTDSEGLQSTDTCLVNVVWVNDPPVANAGPDQTVEQEQQVVLSGSQSIDPDGNGSSLTYLWTQTSGIPVVLSDPTSVAPVFISPIVDQDGEVLTFELIVTDSEGLKNSDTCNVSISWNASTATDLSGSWGYIDLKSLNKKSMLTGSFVVRNTGASNELFYVALYLSDDNKLDNSDKHIAVYEINAGTFNDSTTISIRERLTGIKAGQYIIGVVDAFDSVTETDEVNNVAYIKL